MFLGKNFSVTSLSIENKKWGFIFNLFSWHDEKAISNLISGGTFHLKLCKSKKKAIFNEAVWKWEKLSILKMTVGNQVSLWLKSQRDAETLAPLHCT